MGKNLRPRDAVTQRLGVGQMSQNLRRDHRLVIDIALSTGMAPHWGKCVFLASPFRDLIGSAGGPKVNAFRVPPGVLGTLMTSSVSASGRYVCL